MKFIDAETESGKRVRINVALIESYYPDPEKPLLVRIYTPNSDTEYYSVYASVEMIDAAVKILGGHVIGVTGFHEGEER